MRQQTRQFVDESWADLFGIGPDALWAEATVRPHGRLGDYAGVVVAWRCAGVHVSTPPSRTSEIAESLAAQGIRHLQAPTFWSGFARSVGLDLIGPSTHHYLDEDLGAPAAVVPIEASELEPMREAVTREEWDESGLGDDAQALFGLRENGRLLAAAGLASYADAPRDVGVLVIPDARGRRLVDEVGRAAASYAVSRHGFARWRARTTNRGFARRCPQAGVRAVVHAARDPLTPGRIVRGWRASSSAGCVRTPRCRRRGRA